MAVVPAGALLALALSTVAYGVGAWLQALAVDRVARDEGADPRATEWGAGPGGRAVVDVLPDRPTPAPSLLRRAVLSPLFLAGGALDLVAVGLAALALRELPVFLVQGVGVASVAVTAVLCAAAGRPGSGRRLAVGVVAASLGCALLVAAAEPGAGGGLPGPMRTALMLAAPLLAALAMLLARGTRSRGSGLLLSALAGLAFAGLALLLRDDGGGTDAERLVPAAALAVSGTLLFALALDRTSVVLASGVVACTELAVPSAIGLLALGDRFRPGLGALAVAGAVLVAVALAQLSAATDPDPAPDGTPPVDPEAAPRPRHHAGV